MICEYSTSEYHFRISFSRCPWIIGAETNPVSILSGNILRCPQCGAELSDLQRFSAEGKHVVDGVLPCESCGICHPIIGGIPRLVPNHLRGELFRSHRAWFESHRLLHNNVVDLDRHPEIEQVHRTMRSFGYQWNVFDEVYPEWHKDFLNYISPPVGESFFAGKMGLDAGCGMGRHTRVAAQLGAEMVGMDLSQAVEAAYRNTRDLSNVHVVQGDICNPPFAQDVFDFVYSIGVLHHLPCPRDGFIALSHFVKSGGVLFIWVYSETKNPVYSLCRRVTTRFPLVLLRPLCLSMAAVAWAGFVVPYQFVRKLRLQSVAGHMKFKRYSDYPFRALYTDFFDELSAPIIHGHRENEIRKWYSEVEYSQIITSSTEGLGWRGYGVR